MTLRPRFAASTIEPGTRVVIEGGPFQGVPATVVLTDDQDVIAVLVPLLDGPMVLEMPASGVGLDGTGTRAPIAH